MNAVRHYVFRTLMLVALLVSTGAFAQTSPASDTGPRWACWYDAAAVSIRCLLGRLPADDLGAQAEKVSATMDRRLSGLVRTMWVAPEKLTGKLISIPLWNTPYEMDFARELAESVMCGVRADCSVRFDRNADGRAPVRAIALLAGASEDVVSAEVMAQGLQFASHEVEAAAELPAPVSPRRRRGING